ncbi:zinc-ribbon domain-containing protein [Sorangium sp. So ce1128]
MSTTNCLSSVAPKVAREWHPTRNGNLTPNDVTAGSDRLVWWRCPKGPDHEWQTEVELRGRRGLGCPFCAGKRPSVTNCLETRYPELAAEWHKTRNGLLTPQDVTPGSDRKVWWRCPRNRRHVWSASIANRVAGNGCSHCAGQAPGPQRSLAVRAPHLAAFWHPTKNGDLSPADVTLHSRKKVWWKCPKGPDHEWCAAPTQRATMKVACPFCASDRVSITNCLATRFPAVAREWHPTLNGALTPRDIMGGSARMAWWRCLVGHVFRASICNRTLRGSGCRECWRRKRPQALTVKRRRVVWLPGDWT